MDTTTYVTGETRVLSASTAARVRLAWLPTEVKSAQRLIALDETTCVSMMSRQDHAGSNDHGFAINTFPTRSGPPL